MLFLIIPFVISFIRLFITPVIKAFDGIKEVSRQYQSIAKVREKLTEETETMTRNNFNAYLKRLDQLGINAVTVNCTGMTDRLTSVYKLFMDAVDKELYLDQIEDDVPEFTDQDEEAIEKIMDGECF